MQLLSGARLSARIFLFDLDGTLIDSRPLFERLWSDWGRKHGIPPADILHVSHGRRLPETIALFAHEGMDQEAEARALLAETYAAQEGLSMVPGAADFLARLPAARWAIVTSSYPDLTRQWLRRFALPVPRVLVTALDVTRGKPAPDCYEMGARALGYGASEAIVFEDAPAGIAAGQAAGASVIALATTFPGGSLGAVRWISDFTRLSITPPDADGVMVLSVT